MSSKLEQGARPMTQSNLKEVLARLIHDWKSKQKWNSWECGTQLETELAHFPP